MTRFPEPGAAAAARPGAAALAGSAGVAAALAAGELASAVLEVEPSPVLAVGGRFVDEFAASLKELAVSLFGTNDKAALVTGTVLISIALGAGVGVLARRHRWVPAVTLAAFAAFGAWAQLGDARDPGAVVWFVAVVEVLVGVAVIDGLLRLAGGAARPSGADAPREPEARVGGRSPGPGTAPAGPSGEASSQPAALMARRRFLGASAAVVASSVLATLVARSLQMKDVVSDAAASFRMRLPGTRQDIPSVQPFTVEGATPYVVPNRDFYRIDTALRVPQVDAHRWRLRVEGMVDRPFEVGYGELLELPSVEQAMTLQCVSNEVGGDLVGNAVWQGVPLRDLLDRAGVQDGAEQVFSRSVDGWTCGFPTAALDGERTALVAYAMNGEPLPAAHGFPARLVVAGLYGYVSATKWLQSISLTAWDGVDGYWIPRGWGKEGPIKLTSRIDVPRSGDRIAGTPATLGGVAWLPATGISAVEVSIDEGRWERAELGRVASEDTWVQWRYQRELAAGEHVARVRAVDADGRVQTADSRPPEPDGATGLHRVTFRVT